MNNFLNEDSQAMLLISSSLAITPNEKEKLKAYTLTEWNKLANKLLSSDLKSPKSFFHTSCDEWKSSLSLTDLEVERLKALLNNGAQLAFELDKLSSSGIWITTRAESTYPILLKDRLKQKCPVFLYCAGNSNLFKTKGVGIVGSRNIDQKALDFTKVLSERCTFDGYSIISGGAKGVDSVAQNIALQNDGTVISIVSDSMASKIRAKDTRESIMKKRLLMVSLFHPNMTFKVYNAMERNKYIYALSQFAVAVSSDYNKGGTWAGATENLKNNWVPLFVRKEDGIPKGNNELIEIGALALEKEKVLNRDVSIENWLSKDKNNISKDKKEEQITLEHFLNQEQSSGIDDSKEIKDSGIKDVESIEIQKVPNNIEADEFLKKEIISSLNITAYEILKPYLLEILNKEKTIDELTTIFAVKKSQMQDWIEILIVENCIKKLIRPVRYIRV